MILFPTALDRAALFSSLGLVAALLLSRVGDTTEEAGRLFAGGGTAAVAVGLVLLLQSGAVTVYGERPEWVCTRSGWQGSALLAGWGAACLAFAAAIVAPSDGVQPLLAGGLIAYALGALAGIRRGGSGRLAR